MKLVTTFVAGAAFVALATPAAAAVTSGARVEALVGWDRPSIDFTDFGLDERFSSDGVAFGIGAGYDLALSEGAALGVDVEASGTSADIVITDGTDSAELSFGRDLYVGGRVTFPVSPRANLYLKAGYTNVRVTGTTTSGGIVETDSANADGIRGGIGAQFSIGTNAYVGGEYRYSDYEAGFARHQALLTLGFRM